MTEVVAVLYAVFGLIGIVLGFGLLVVQNERAATEVRR